MRTSTRIIAAVLSVQVASLVTGIWVSHLRTTETLRTGFAGKIEAISQVIGSSVTPLLCGGEPERLTDYLRTVSRGHLLSYAVISRGGQVLASAGEVARRVGVGGKADRDAAISKNRIYPAYVDLIPCRSGESGAELEIGMDFQSLDQPLKGVISSEMASFFLQLLVALALTIYTRRLIDSRTGLIETACKRISEGKFGELISVDGNDEFSIIAKQINSMSHSLKLIQKERDEQRQSLAETAKLSSLGEMAAGVAHEINNPLAIIRGRIEQMSRLLEESVLDREKGKQHLANMTLTVERIAKIVRGLKLFSRNADRDSMQPVELRQVIEETLGLCMERFRNAGIEIRLQLRDEVKIFCRPTQVSQILINLLNNSYDAIETLAEKWIEVSIEMLPDRLVQVTVTDSGRGIKPEIAEKIMEPFFTTKPTGRGTGLGLSISKAIIEDHQGKLFLDQHCPHTRFCLRFPAFEQEMDNFDQNVA
jgi:C4-dicarboxylate-specific signal transduction histidine kinase